LATDLDPCSSGFHYEPWRDTRTSCATCGIGWPHANLPLQENNEIEINL